jgi:hypothetical protein
MKRQFNLSGNNTKDDRRGIIDEVSKLNDPVAQRLLPKGWKGIRRWGYTRYGPWIL